MNAGLLGPLSKDGNVTYVNLSPNQVFYLKKTEDNQVICFNSKNNNIVILPENPESTRYFLSNVGSVGITLKTKESEYTLNPLTTIMVTNISEKSENPQKVKFLFKTIDKTIFSSNYQDIMNNWVISMQAGELFSIKPNMEDGTVYFYAVGYESKNYSNRQGLIIKFDFYGNILQQKQIYSSVNFTEFRDLCIIRENNVDYIYVCGVFPNTTSDRDGFLIKLNSNGAVVQQKRISASSSEDNFTSITYTIEDGTTYIHTCGVSGSTPRIQIVKWDLNGNVIKSNFFGISGSYILSRKMSTVYEDGTAFIIFSYGDSINYYTRAALVKIDTDYNIIQQQIQSQSNGDTTCNFVTISLENNIPYLYIGGSCSSIIETPRAYLQKINSNSNVVWKKKFGSGNASIENFDACVTEENNVKYIYTVGYERITATNNEAMILKQDTSGQIIQQRKIGDSNNEYFNGCCMQYVDNIPYIFAVGREGSNILITRQNISQPYQDGYIPNIPTLFTSNISLSFSDSTSYFSGSSRTMTALSATLTSTNLPIYDPGLYQTFSYFP